MISFTFAMAGGIAQATAPQPVTLKAPDGIALKATYYPAGHPGPGILLLHACNRDRSSWAHLAGEAAARGYHVLALDYRGYGESEGQRFQQFQEQQPIIDGKWPGDIDAAYAWLTAQPGVDRERIAASGASCGVNQSVQLARRHPEVRTVVLLSGTVTAAGREYLSDASWLPILGAASRDDGDAVAVLRWVLGWSRNSGNKFVEYQAAGHGTDMFGVEKGLEPIILDWFDTHLRDAATDKPAVAASSEPTAVETFWKTLTEPGGIARARQLYLDTKRRRPDVVLFPETELNLYGYQLLQGGRATDAVAVFRLNVEAYPGSANTYDSLSDGYLALGIPDEAFRYAQKALEVLATDTRAPEELRNAIRASAEKKVKALRRRE
ncbi:MAG: alpha/beta fold hydrolase [Vicinamibacterales bacterium]